MARKRMLSNELWRDRKVIKLSNDALILWIAMITFADDEGLFEYDQESWFYEIARKEITPERISNALIEIIALDMVVMYGDGYGLIPSWYKHQSLSHPTATKLPRPPKSILESYPDYILAWQKTFTTYQKDSEGDRISVVPKYPFPDESDIFRKVPESSGNIQKVPGSIDKYSLVKSSLVECSIEEYAPASQSPSLRKRFQKPTLEEVRAYCKERNNQVDPQAFLDFYESKGWRIGTAPMKDWQASVRTWEKRDNGKTSYQQERVEIDYPKPSPPPLIDEDTARRNSQALQELRRRFGALGVQ